MGVSMCVRNSVTDLKSAGVLILDQTLPNLSDRHCSSYTEVGVVWKIESRDVLVAKMSFGRGGN